MSDRFSDGNIIFLSKEDSDRIVKAWDESKKEKELAKAFEWAARFNKEDREAVLTDYALETRDLADKRSKTSKDKYKKAAIEGAVREQRQKFLAVCGRVEGLTIGAFDDMMNKHLSDLSGKPKPSPAKVEEKEEEVTDGRELVRTVHWDKEQTAHLQERLAQAKSL